jgi:hypothetical protein
MEGRTREGLDARAPTRPEHLSSAGEPIGASEWLLLRMLRFSALARSFFDGGAPAEPRAHIAQTLNARARLRLYATCRALQTLVARRCKGHEAFGLESTADVVLTTPPTQPSWALRFYGICRQKREPTSGLKNRLPLLQLRVCLRTF